MINKYPQIPIKPRRRFVPQDIVIDAWEKIESLFDKLLNREINSCPDLEKWMMDRTELEAVLEEDMAWRYIKMNINTEDKDLAKSFHFWIQNISPNGKKLFIKQNVKRHWNK